MQVRTYQLSYPFSKVWLILWLVFYFPIGLVLMTRVQYVTPKESVRWDYQGSRFWLYFWAVLFFPIAILLFLFNNSLVITQTNSQDSAL
ncbi:MAG: hypothetical protein COT85_01490 [Chlamydiae bacterium CG10_big_fil_rev_8_21_14_0_10_42_34]|nr:MAG: hypothetical protein COT85_01490 [Chlamydiae bacterium CG10_big_fil_rev_8_21_14_0_10_42_34]